MGETSSGTARFWKRNCRNWTELPDDVTASILSRLGAIEILETAQKVCVKWRNICKDPLMWRTIDMRNDGDLDDMPYDLEFMCYHAVDRSCAGLVDINVEHFGTDELLKYITHSSSGIRRLRLACCHSISDEGLRKVASKLPLLEDLDISLCELSHKSVEVVGRSCPLLKSFKFNKEWFRVWDDDSDHYYDSDDEPPARYLHYYDSDGYDDSDDETPAPFNKSDDSDALAIAATMHNLGHLQLFGNKMTDDGLRKILDCCPHLESFDLRHCFNLNFGGDLGRRCTEQIKNLWLPHDSTKGYEFAAKYDGFCQKWTELPDNVTASILSRVGAIDILESAQKVCMKWRRICKDPLMWRTIDMRNLGDLHDMPYDLEVMCSHAIDRSCGDLVDINIEYFGTDETLKYITDSSSKIRRLQIACCYGVSDEGLIEVASKLPLLEDLEISLCKLSRKSLEVIERSCPLLKSFKLNNEWHKFSDDFFVEDSDDEFAFRKDDDAVVIAGTMHGLHHLQLFGNQLTNDGLRKLLDCCPRLESLDLRYCFNLDLGGDLGRMCAERIEKLLLPNDSIVGYKFSPSTEWRGSYKPDESYVRPIWDPYDSSDY